MKKILFLAGGLLLFGCENANRSNEAAGTENTTSDAPGSVEKGAGNEVSPQLEGVQDTATRLQVDTVSNASDANKPQH